jgi:hypothetical protein
MAADGETAPQENGTKLSAAQKKKLKAKQRKQNKRAERWARARRGDRAAIVHEGCGGGRGGDSTLRLDTCPHKRRMPLSIWHHKLQGGARCHTAGQSTGAGRQAL